MNVTFEDKKGQKYTFIHIPKNAGKTISAYVTRHALNLTTLHEQSHATVHEMKSLGVDLGITFAVVRNPYSRAVSAYRYIFEVDIDQVVEETKQFFMQKHVNVDWWIETREKYPSMTFESFVKQLPWMPLCAQQHKFLPVDLVLKLETLEKDFKIIQDKLPTTEPLFKINSTHVDNWRDYYTSQETANEVYRAYKKDFKILGYSKRI